MFVYRSNDDYVDFRKKRTKKINKNFLETFAFLKKKLLKIRSFFESKIRIFSFIEQKLKRYP